MQVIEQKLGTFAHSRVAVFIGGASAHPTEMPPLRGVFDQLDEEVEQVKLKWQARPARYTAPESRYCRHLPGNRNNAVPRR